MSKDDRSFNINGVGCASALAVGTFLVFLALKLMGYITWAWWWVVAPLWIYALAIAVLVVVVVLAILAAKLLVGKW